MKGKNEQLKLFLSTPWKDVVAVDVQLQRRRWMEITGPHHALANLSPGKTPISIE